MKFEDKCTLIVFGLIFAAEVWMLVLLWLEGKYYK